PIDEVRIGELENHAVAYATGSAQGFGAIAGNPDAGNFAAGPGEFCRDAVEVDGFAGVEIAKDADKLLEVFERSGFLAEDAAGAVTPADAEFHAAVRSKIQCGEEACGNRDIAHGWIGNAGAKAHFLGSGSHQSEERKRLLPDNVGIENPAEGEAGGLGLAREGQNAVNGDVRFDGNAEVHKN